ncbi:phosphatidylglycerol lysyltransferase [Catenulispora sp. MAP5-51]|uniref:bifunctional lysylphosphatidylglycerol flippase/synthetase MprF n=1 Tax=Catenulispora sp. MAP5-51 TaxID=3156298 RepID=UPI003518104B
MSAEYAPTDRPGRPDRPGFLGAVPQRVGRIAGRAPLTTALVALLVVVALVAGSAGGDADDALDGRVGTGPAILGAGKWWTPLTYGLWSVGPTALIATLLLAIAVLAPAERRLGAPATLGLFVLCQAGGALLGTAVIELGARTGDVWLGSDRGDAATGASVGVVGVGLALSARLSPLWRRRLRLVFGFGVVLFMLYDGTAQDVMRFCGATVGFTTGVLLWGRKRPRRERVVSHAESRVLVAIAVGTSALGPLIAYLTRAPYGPLSLYSDLFVGSGPGVEDLRSTCNGVADMSGDCLQVRSEYLLASSPAVLMLFVPAVLLLIVAEGLRRGRRLALLSAVLIEAGAALVTWRYAVQVLSSLDPSDPDYADAHRFVIQYSIPLVAIPVLVIVLLLAKRRHFQLRVSRRTVLKVSAAVAAAFVALGAAYVQFGYAVREEFTPVPGIGGLAADFIERLIPPVYLGILDAPSAHFLPQGGAARMLYVWAGPVFWAVTLSGLLLAFWRSPMRYKTASEAEARALLTTYGGSTLSYMTTWPGHEYWITRDARAAVAYRVIGKVALTTGGPFGDPQVRDDVLGEFAEYCDQQGWTPCFYSVTAETLDAATRLGWSGIQVAEDTVLALPDLAFTGKKWQDVRTALNKAGKEGIAASWVSFPDAPQALRKQVRDLSHEWVAGKGLPEMGFTLGGLDELDDPQVRCLVAVDGAGRLHGVTSWLPCYRDGEPVGWTLDFMRRSSEGFRGVMEFLIATAATQFKQEGAEFMSLSGAPLARTGGGPQPDGLQRLLDGVGRVLEPVYGFRSLLAFKAKFQPQYRPLYIAYPDPVALPAITNAIGRAYLPRTTPGQMLRLSRRLLG